MKTFVSLTISAFLVGCSSYFTPRPPVIEDKVGIGGKNIVGTLSTAADYRVVYVKLEDNAKLCAEASPDAGAQFASTFATAFSSQPGGAAPPLSLEAKAGLAVAMKHLFKRSQGVQLYRDGSFALCNLYLNGGITGAQYLSELQDLRKASVDLIKQEIPFLERNIIDPIQVPAVPVPADTGRKDGGQ